MPPAGSESWTSPRSVREPFLHPFRDPSDEQSGISDRTATVYFAHPKTDHPLDLRAMWLYCESQLRHDG
jgi:hypothetical protein